MVALVNIGQSLAFCKIRQENHKKIFQPFFFSFQFSGVRERRLVSLNWEFESKATGKREDEKPLGEGGGGGGRQHQITNNH